MRLLHRFSALSLGLLSLTLGGQALAAPGLVTKTGRFPAASTASGAAGKRASVSALERAATSLLLEQIPSARGAELGRAITVDLSSGERVVKLPQLHQGVPVAFRGAAVTFAGDNVAEVISSKLERDLPSTVTPSITKEQAAALASGVAGVELDPARAALAVWPLPDGPRLVWGIDSPVLAPLPYQPVVLVDAHSGEIVLKYNAVTSLNQASVYPSNPDKSPMSMQVTLPVGAGQTTLQNDLVTSLNCIDNHNVKMVNLMALGIPISIPMHLCDLLQTAKAGTSGDYLSIMPAAGDDPQDDFSELSMFYHVNRAYSFFRNFAPTLAVDPEAIPTVSNLRFPQGFDDLDLQKLSDPSLPLDPVQNAFFAPKNPLFEAIFGFKGGAMFFGQGPARDYSYDGDVIYHEFTHAVVNVTLKLIPTPHLDEYGATYAPGAMNEGLADFFSSALTGDPDVGEYASKDINANLTAIRSLSNPDKCPSAVGGEVHQDATLFSGALWDARKELSTAQQADFDAAVFKAMNSSPTGDLSYDDFATLLVKTVAGSPLGQPVADALSAAFTNRGLLPKCTRVLESTGAALTGPAELKGRWFAPGTQTTGAAHATEGYTPGVFQAHQALKDAGKLLVNFKSVDIGGGAGGVLGMQTPFTPKLLVRFGAAPIQFTYDPSLKTTDDVKVVSLTNTATDYTGEVDVPSGATDVYVMVVNAGQADGAFTSLQLAAEAAPSTTSSTSTAASTSAATSSGAGGGDSGPGPEETGGCGCAVPGQDTSGAAAALTALGALGFLAARRRKRA